MKMIDWKTLPRLVWLCAALVTTIAYQPGLTGGFVFDDFHAIVRNDKILAITGNWTGAELTDAAVSSSSGLLRRPVSMTSFALNHAVGGMEPYGFKLTNLILHLTSGLFAFLVSQNIARRLIPHSRREGADLAASFAAAIWLLHPLNLSTVLYVVQRMTILSALFTLMGLLCFVEGRNRMIERGNGFLSAIGGLMVFGLLATLSKENGALIVVYALAIELICFRFASARQHDRNLLRGFFVLTCALPVLLVACWAIAEPTLVDRMYELRDFSIVERLLTQCRIILHYLSWIALPLPSALGLYHDDIAVSRSLLSPPATVIALIVVVALTIFAVVMSKHRQWSLCALAILWFLGGHLMESTVLPLEMVFEHRNYLPMLGPILAVTIALSPTNSSAVRSRAFILLAAVAASLAALTHSRAHDWSSPLKFAQAEAAHHPMSARANYEAGRETQLSAERGRKLVESAPIARRYFVAAMNANPTYPLAVAGLVLTYMGEARVPEELISELAHRMQVTPDPKAAVVLGVVSAYESGSLVLSPADAFMIIEAILENPRATIRQRAIALNELGRLHFRLLGDSQKAVSYTLAAIEQEPRNPLFRLNAANLALALGRTDLAKRYAAEAQHIDEFGLYKAELSELLDSDL